MIDTTKIAPLKVIAKIEKLSICNLPRAKEYDPDHFSKIYKGAQNLHARRLREYEIRSQSPIGKFLLAKHHIEEIHNNIKNILNREPLNGKLNIWRDVRSICNEIENYPNQILNRLAPALIALDSLDQNHQVRAKFHSFTSNFEAQIAKAHNHHPRGKGAYKKRLRELTVIGKNYLQDCLGITNALLIRHFN